MKVGVLAQGVVVVGRDVSLLHGWLPTCLQLLALALAVVAVARRGGGWWTRWVPLAVVVGAVVGLGCRWYSTSQGMTGAPLPWILWVWFGLAAGAVVVAAVGWPYGRRAQQVAAVLTVVISLAAGGAVLNQWAGYLRTVGQALALAVDEPLPGEIPLARAQELRGTGRETGAVVHVHAPTPDSGLAHRDEVVYLPPAWFAAPAPPELPVVELVSAAFNTPEDWVRVGHADVVAEDYARAHGGRAPILVMADVNGSMGNDSECVDGPRGHTATYAVRDLPTYVTAVFGTARDPARWGIAGWSMGGTCAVSLTAAFPERFHTFLDIAGDLRPNAGGDADTLERLYGGDTALRDRFDPVTAMRAHGTYWGVEGRFVDGDRTGGVGGLGGLADQLTRDVTGTLRDRTAGPPVDPFGPEASSVLCPEARAHGIACEVDRKDLPHQWQLAELVFREQFDWLAGRILR